MTERAERLTKLINQYKAVLKKNETSKLMDAKEVADYTALMEALEEELEKEVR
jgi:hypothetical protein